MSTGYQLLDLPNEVLQLIWRHCDTETLKNVRLGCSTWANQMVGPFLFTKITLIPHLYFTDRFIDAFRPSPLRNHIKTISIELCCLEAMYNLADNSCCGPRRVSYNTTHRASSTSLYSMDELNEIYTEPRGMHLINLETAALTGALSILPCLTDVHANFDFRHQSICKRPPALRALIQNLGLDSKWIETSDDELSSERYTAHWPVISALSVGASKIKVLRIEEFDPYRIVSGDCVVTLQSLAKTHNKLSHPALLFAAMANKLKHLELQLNDCHDDGYAEVTANTTVQLLGMVTKLQSLRLHCHSEMSCIPGGQPWMRGSTRTIASACKPLLPFFQQARLKSIKPAFEQLRTLWLQNTAANWREYLDFFVQDCPQLENLTIKNCMLLKMDQANAAFPCWISLLHDLKASLNLVNIDFQGFLTNTGKQHWHISDKASTSDGDVKSKMIKWFLSKDFSTYQCPLRACEIKVGGTDLIGKESDLRAATDKTWSMECPCDIDESSDIRG